MKTALLTLVLLSSQISFAQIKNSSNEKRHQNAIVASVEAQCGRMSDLTQVSQTVTSVSVDQGITDLVYTTVLTGQSRIDQMMYVPYQVTVESVQADMYDHATGNWGAYIVNSVSCLQK